ncbi:MAG: hypothetical protein IJ001_01470 [Oscillospiraceae bacterium]|nr:hypothetical protein [Oscillospiraceae bacterium]
MKEITIRIGSVQQVLDFVSLATARPFRITVSDGHHNVNGKSFLEMFCLNAQQPLKVSFDCSEEEFQQFSRDTEQFQK